MVQLLLDVGGVFFCISVSCQNIMGGWRILFFSAECPARFSVFLYLYAKGAFCLVWAAIDFFLFAYNFSRF